ncbi:maltose alpha-D-glucosyltransferase [Amantichitinum ursilacus]|uniref:maltose alpha-D-glucosyltransferase n=1 Tax=Amantichitinum ursilacus TaxID=857265 RepID=A0A0N0GPG9_9NEIS|nr:maltose alpha-D-glucosyltransferase [Amantichitinum ursilacus]KPC53803.1 Trehalose synthase/amylase TreS [Amantichitinum ursilacus]
MANNTRGKHAVRPAEWPPAEGGNDTLWYRDAIIYQVHVKSFMDANNDGIGDFKGLISKLDYIASLGVDAIWLLPFYPSPRKDDGYDVSDYKGVHPDYGTLADAREFMAQAHARKLRVITDLVLNHTSDQHAWFQRARQAPRHSRWRDFYVWSDTDQKYAGTRIIFSDTEKSNWTWDPVANQYYWHRFFAHQPDLNFDNPRVMEAVLRVVRFWLDMGVDGFRLDAVSYLIEREGTLNEHLPETHAVLKKLRAFMDEHYPGRMLLAEANAWPEDMQQYFGNGDECNMAFHFPLMPRMYMAIAREDRFPITDILRQTPNIPDNCQWAIFLRNHDELTLEMVTDAERDYLWQTYAADRRARLNLGIRRRLAPLMERDRRRIELMNSLLLSMPGTPVIYYGDEIGMGDNIHLGDRDGVRTPMQWSPDRNGGFSLADPEQLVLPAVMGTLYGYESVNVEAQIRDGHSLLNSMRRMIAVRRRHHAFGRGTINFLHTGNRRILAYLREMPGEAPLLCVANLARTAQAVELDIPDYAGRIPLELMGGAPFPEIGSGLYTLTLPPYGFYWLEISEVAQRPAWSQVAEPPMPELTTLVVRNTVQTLETLLSDQDGHRAQLEREVLPAYLTVRRWYPGSQRLPVRLAYMARIDERPTEPGGLGTYLCEIEVSDGQQTGSWLLPLGIYWEQQGMPALVEQRALFRVRRGRQLGYLTDAVGIDSFARGLVKAFADHREIPLPDGGHLRFETPDPTPDLTLPEDAQVRWVEVQDMRGLLVVDDLAVIKMDRLIEHGIHEETELLRYLAEQNFERIPHWLGHCIRVDANGDENTLLVMHRFVRNQGRASTWIVDNLNRSLNDLLSVAAAADASAAQRPALEQSDWFVDLLDNLTPPVRAAGLHLGEMHKLFAANTSDEAFAPRPATTEDTTAWADRAHVRLREALDALALLRNQLPEDAQARLDNLSALQLDLQDAGKVIATRAVGSRLQRIHGAMSFDNVLMALNDVLFGGFGANEPELKRIKTTPMRDVAGLLESLDMALDTASQDPAHTMPTPHAERQRLIEMVRSTLRVAALTAWLEAWDGDSGEIDRALTEGVLDLLMLEAAARSLAITVLHDIQLAPAILRRLGQLADRVLSLREKANP